MSKQEIIDALKELRELKQQVIDYYNNQPFSRLHINDFIKKVDTKILSLIELL